MKKFCVLALQRSGSTWIMDSIQRSVQSAGVFAEVFLDQPAGKDPWSEPQGNLEPPVRYVDWRNDARVFSLTAPGRYLSFLEMHARKEPLFGFKIMYNQLIKKPWLAWSLKQRNYSVLHLKRSNLLDVYISGQKIDQVKPHLRSGDPAAAKVYEPIRIAPQTAYLYIKGFIRREKAARMIMKMSGLAMETVEYELLAGNDRDEVEKLNRFIGQPVDLFSRKGLQKRSPAKTAMKITNYQEVINYFEKKRLDKSCYTGKSGASSSRHSGVREPG